MAVLQAADSGDLVGKAVAEKITEDTWLALQETEGIRRDR